MADKKFLYKGKKLQKNNEEKGLDVYIPSDALKEAVNVMLLLQERPLLLMGEPGCGKTRLAEAVGFELYEDEFEEGKNYFRWNIKSSTKARDGLYRYDALRRLSDVQMKQEVKDGMQLDVKNGYIKSGEMGKAFSASKVGKPAILLIDEIDKADPDFANDLLNELEDFNFVIEETGKSIPKPEAKPLVFITSNGEKDLPSAFLRRCLFHFIEFPKPEQLKAILTSRYEKEVPEFLEKAVGDFNRVRNQIKKKAPGNEKKVSTSELLDWFKLLLEVDSLSKQSERSNEEQQLVAAFEKWKQSSDNKLEQLPFYQVLLKNIESLDIMAKSGLIQKDVDG